MPESVTIRPTGEADLEGLHRTLDAVARERRWLAMTAAPPLEMVRSFRHSFWESGSVDLVAVSPEGEIVGWVDIQRISWEGMRHVGVLGMGLLAAYRGRGLGRRLLQAALEAAGQAGMSRVELEVFISNSPAVSLYRATGFEEEGRKRGARVLEGQVDDLLVMACQVEVGQD
jgi:ribosomal protein S18 acetylase RimI-like enzyme